MSWIGYTYTGFPYLFRRRWGARRNWGGLLRGIRRGTRSMMRGARPRRHGRGCCCCPAFFLLGLAGVGLLAGFIYLGIRFVGWA